VALTERGIPALGVDISRTAVARVRRAGAPAWHGSVFDPLPGPGRWATVLLADGNIGIGGRPARLLRRCAQLLAPGGRIIIEAEPGEVDEQLTAWLEHPDSRRGPVFPWARMGTAALLGAAAEAGLHITGQWRRADRAFVCATTAGKTGTLSRRLLRAFASRPALTADRGGSIMSVKLALLATLEAKDGKGDDLGAFLRAGRELAVTEDGTVTWYAFRIDETHYGIFDTFESEDGRTAHLNGPIPQALGEVASELLATEPSIRPVDIVAVK
jgi:quinol monooxygenase YgiN